MGTLLIHKFTLLFNTSIGIPVAAPRSIEFQLNIYLHAFSNTGREKTIHNDLILVELVTFSFLETA